MAISGVWTLRYFLPCVSVAFMACHPWYWVESEYRGATLEEQPPEIAATSVYRSLVRPGLSVALSAPDKCADQSAAQASGGPASAGELLATTCGVEMAELERALVESGFRVVSWNAVRQMVLYKEHVTPLEAAQQLNATVLFQVNSLERSKARRSHELEWERSFYEWELGFFEWFFGIGTNGSKGPLVEVPDDRAKALENRMSRVEQAARPREQVSVTVNATAILAESGETIWFYSWTHAEEFDEEVRATQLFECHRSKMFRCIEQKPRSDVAPPPPRSGSKGRVLRAAQSASPADAAYYRLVRGVIADLVGRFAGQ